jgi:hypothetical protein
VAHKSSFLLEFTRAVLAAICCQMKVPNVPFQLMYGMANTQTLSHQEEYCLIFKRSDKQNKHPISKNCTEKEKQIRIYP